MADTDRKKKFPADAETPDEVEPTRVYGTGLGTSSKDRSYTESHPSYGMIRFSRTYGGGGVRMFGSPIESPTTIRLEICEAVVNRDLSRDWYHSRRQLIEVRMSPAQFAELITSLNMGDGTPCTLVRVAGEGRPDCPHRPVREEITSEFEAELKRTATDLRAGMEAAIAILDNKAKKNLTNDDRNTLRAALDRVGRFLTDHAPFIHSQFNEAMDKTAVAVKAEVAAAITTMAHSLGVKELAERFKSVELGGQLALPAADGDAPPPQVTE